MLAPASSIGDLLRGWRQRRRMSQLELALETEISTKHLSFLETGRSQPSREMVMRLAEQLRVPMRERNVMLLTAGFAPAYAERSLDDPALAPARAAVDLILRGHEPYPALAIDRHWTLIAANAAVAPLLQGLPPELLQPPVNVLRLSLHPEGLGPRIVNLPEWRAHLLARLWHQIDVSGDPALIRLLAELKELSAPEAKVGTGRRTEDPVPRDLAGIVVPLRLATPAGILSLISTTTVFGTPVDLTLSELALETFFPADQETAKVLRRIAGAPGPSFAGDAPPEG
jgi:transcriptional regulator with XRE-family HTH domain